jgi:hypothetical protein
MTMRGRLCLSPLPLSLGWALLLSLLAMPLAAETVREKEGRLIIEHWLKSKAVDAEMNYLSMQTVDPNGSTEERRILAVYRRDPSGASQYLLRLIAPEEVEGVTVVATREADGNVRQGIYLPTVGRLRPLSGEAQVGPFLGSDFSYEDLVEEIPSEQSYERLPDRFIHGSECYVVKATPRDPAKSAYGYREVYLDKHTFDLLRIDFFGPEGEFQKYFAAYDYDSPRIAGRGTRPHRAVMTDIKANTSTILTVVQSRIGQGIPPEIFTAESIENWSDEAIDAFIFDMFLEVRSSPLPLD